MAQNVQTQNNASQVGQIPSENQAGNRPWWFRDGNQWLILAGIAYSIVYLVLWPATFAIMDEASYMGTAYAMRKGTVYTDIAGITSIFTYRAQGHLISQYPPGMPLLLAAVSFLGWKITLLTNLFVHLGIFAVVAAILRHLKVPVVCALLYLFHPTAVIYSRTIMADLPASLLLALSFWMYLKRKYALAGVFIGLSVLMRNANILALPLMGLAALLDDQEGSTGAGVGLWERYKGKVIAGIKLVAGTMPFYLLAFLYQKVLQEGGWARFSNQLGLHYLPHGVFSYAVLMSVLFPGMFFAPLFYKGEGKRAILLLGYGFVALYSAYQFMDATGSAVESFVVGQRYMLVVIPLFLVAYTFVLWRWLPPAFHKRIGVAFALCCTVLGIGTVAVQYKHQQYLKGIATTRDRLVAILQPTDTLICNIHTAKLLHPGWDSERSFTIIGQMNDLPRDMRIAKRPITAALAERKGRILVISWSRDYRRETSYENQVFDSIEAAYDNRPLSPAERSGLPEEMRVMEITGTRK